MCQLCEKQGDQVSFTHFHLLLHPKCTPWDIPAWAVGLDKITSKGPFQPQSLSSSPRTMTGTGKKTECCFPHTVWFLPFLSSPVSAKKSSSFSCTIFPVVLGSCPLFCQLEPERLAYSSDLPVSKLLLWQISVLKLTNIEGNFLSLGTVVQIRAVLGLVGFTLCQTVRDHHWMFYTIGEKCTREGVWSLFGGISACLTSLFLPPAAHTLVCGGECFKQSKLKSVKISLAGTTSVPWAGGDSALVTTDGVILWARWGRCREGERSLPRALMRWCWWPEPWTGLGGCSHSALVWGARPASLLETEAVSIP